MKEEEKIIDKKIDSLTRSIALQKEALKTMLDSIPLEAGQIWKSETGYKRLILYFSGNHVGYLTDFLTDLCFKTEHKHKDTFRKEYAIELIGKIDVDIYDLLSFLPSSQFKKRLD